MRLVAREEVDLEVERLQIRAAGSESLDVRRQDKGVDCEAREMEDRNRRSRIRPCALLVGREHEILKSCIQHE